VVGETDPQWAGDIAPWDRPACRGDTMTLTLDLHPIFQNEREVDRAVRAIIFEAVRTKATLVEIIPGQGSGKLKNRVLALLRQTHMRRLYKSVETDETNAGRVLVHFA
jgi:DNA-nicking Smr family endonuclease